MSNCSIFFTTSCKWHIICYCFLLYWEHKTASHVLNNESPMKQSNSGAQKPLTRVPLLLQPGYGCRLASIFQPAPCVWISTANRVGLNRWRRKTKISTSTSRRSRWSTSGKNRDGRRNSWWVREGSFVCLVPDMIFDISSVINDYLSFELWMMNEWILYTLEYLLIFDNNIPRNIL